MNQRFLLVHTVPVLLINKIISECNPYLICLKVGYNTPIKKELINKVILSDITEIFCEIVEFENSYLIIYFESEKSKKYLINIIDGQYTITEKSREQNIWQNIMSSSEIYLEVYEGELKYKRQPTYTINTGGTIVENQPTFVLPI